MNYVQSPEEQPNGRRVVVSDMAPTRPVSMVSQPLNDGYEPRRGGAINRFGQVVYVALGALDALLVIRFLLKLLAANPDAGFTTFIYGVTQLFITPFVGVFPSPQTSGSVLEVATLLAIVVYALLAWLIVSVIQALTNRPARPAL